MKPQTLVIGNPENRRVSMFLNALQESGEETAVVIPWLDILQGHVDWERQLQCIRRVRLESSGENAAVERELIAAGAEISDSENPDAQRIDAHSARTLPDDHGRIRFPRQWFLGFKKTLSDIAQRTALATPALWNHRAENVLVMFDKYACQARLAAANIPVAPLLPRIHSYSELITAMNERGWHRVFIKLAHSSSASGVVAYERSGTQQHAYSSAQLVRTDGELRIYNSLKIRRYTSATDISALVDFLAREGVQVEAWLPKASTHGRRFDLRVVVIGGRARHVIVRTSRHPMTNLHLGNARGDVAEIQSLMGIEHWRAAMETCERTLAMFPQSLYAGIDLLVRTDYQRHAVLEVNAFGDLIPNALHDGKSTYSAEIEAQPVPNPNLPHFERAS